MTSMDDPEHQKKWGERRDFYSSVGQAISHWAGMEEYIVRIAAALLGTSEEKTGLMLYSIINFQTWLNIIDELFPLEKDFLPYKDRWGAIADILRKKNDLRVRLAHHTLWNADREKRESAPALYANKFDIRSKTLKYEPLTNLEIVGFIKEITALSGDLMHLSNDIKWVRMHLERGLPAPLPGTRPV